MNLLNRREKEKYVLLPKKVFEAIKEALDATCELKRKLNEYQEPGLSPDEIHMINERLAEFELAGIEPTEAKILADRNKIKPAEIVCGMALCPVCGRVISAEESLKKYPICSRCGQRVAADTLSATSVMPERELGEKTASKASEIFSERGEIDIANRDNERDETGINFDEE